MRYIVLWTVWSYVFSPCPDAKVVNEYTGQAQGFAVCAVMHGSFVFDKNMEKEFTEKEKVVKFIEDAYVSGLVEFRDWELFEIFDNDTIRTKIGPSLRSLAIFNFGTCT